jgi:hypothetical protein
VTLVLDALGSGSEWRVAAGDLDDDGLDDVVLGGVTAEGTGPESGRVWVVLAPRCQDIDRDGHTVDDGDCDDGKDNDCDSLTDSSDSDCDEADTGDPTPDTGDSGISGGSGDSGDLIEEDLDPLPPAEDDNRWARCEFRGSGVVVTLLLLPWGWFRRRTFALGETKGLDLGPQAGPPR